MTIPELQALTRKTLEFGIKTLQETGEVSRRFHLVGRGMFEVIIAEGQITNNERAKDVLAEELRKRAAGRDIEAVIMLSDAFVCDNMDPVADAIRRSFGMTIEQAAKAGLCKSREAVVCMLESPIYAEMLRQNYRRLDGGREIELEGELEQGHRPVSGRFVGLFGKSDAGRTQ